MKRLIAFLIACLPLSATAQDMDRANAMLDAWKTWTKEQRVSNSAIVIAHRGEIVAFDGKNRLPNTPVPVASLGKAITGACIAHLMDQGQLTKSTKLGDIFGADMAGLGKGGADDAAITLKQLLSHSSGFDKDQTQGNLRRLITAKGSLDRPSAARAAGRASLGPKKYFYNNENYAMLGTIIEELTGEDYFAYCTKAVLDPIGVTTAGPDPTFKNTSAFGGWEITPEDYTKFLWATFGPDTPIGKSPIRWPSNGVANGARYGMGTLYRSYKGSYNFWHFGRWCGGPNIGAYFAMYKGEWSAVATYDGCYKGEPAWRLDELLANAALR